MFLGIVFFIMWVYLIVRFGFLVKFSICDRFLSILKWVVLFWMCGRLSVSWWVSLNVFL